MFACPTLPGRCNIDPTYISSIVGQTRKQTSCHPALAVPNNTEPNSSPLKNGWCRFCLPPRRGLRPVALTLWFCISGKTYLLTDMSRKAKDICFDAVCNLRVCRISRLTLFSDEIQLLRNLDVSNRTCGFGDMLLRPFAVWGWQDTTISHTITMRYLYNAPYKIGQRRWTCKKLIKKWSGAT